MPKLLVFQHVAHEPLGTLDPHLRREGFRIRYVNYARHPHAAPEIDDYDALIVLGGPMNVDETEHHPHLRHEVRVIRDALDRGRPVLGICLGAQLLAHALGAPVGRAREPEIGWYEVRKSGSADDDPLLGHFEDVERVFQWHGDTFEIAAGATRLASSERCPNQAFRAGESAWGLQFHLEVDQPMIARWLTTPANARDVSGLHGGPGPILRDTERFVARQRALAEEAFGAFVRRVRAHRAPRTLRVRGGTTHPAGANLLPGSDGYGNADSDQLPPVARATR